MSDLLKDYLYDLPADLIAQQPTINREDSRMLVLERKTATIKHDFFINFQTYVSQHDLVVLNNSKVIPSRLKDDKHEIFLLKYLRNNRWITLVKPGKKFFLGAKIDIAENRAVVEEILSDGRRIIQFSEPINIDKHGAIPLPPYLKRQPTQHDRQRYQTVYATDDGSIAAPTAGLHFTNEILNCINHTFITLHVGLGTFLPVKCENIQQHSMHEENYFLSQHAADRINLAQRHNGKIVCVGTTTARVLESQPEGLLQESSGNTDIFIHIPYQFKRVDRLLTNFHLSGSTLLMMISALVGRELLLNVYQEAIAQKYRFFSYGDSMLIL